MPAAKFDYNQAFDRNLGWLTLEEQAKLRQSTVAIAGLGGAGGFQAQALVRLGITRFKFADPDVFELTNLNRQIGATRESIGQSKVQTLRDMVLSINPEAEIELYPEGIHEGNINAFLTGADLVIDGIDFFALDAKLLLFRKSREKGLPVISSCPLGFGASLLIFSPQGMTFEDYFDFAAEMREEDRSFAFAFGLSPTPLCLSYMNERASELGSRRASSVSPGLMLVGAITGTEAVKLLTGKKKTCFVPTVYQTDLMTQKTVIRTYAQGMRSPLMRLKKWIILKFFLPSQKKPATQAGSVKVKQEAEKVL